MRLFDESASQPHPHRPRLAVVALLAVTSLLATAGCAHQSRRSPDEPGDLVTGTGRAAPPTSRLRAAVGVARRAADLYARSAYRWVPPRLPRESGAVAAALAAAASRVPPGRRNLHPHLAGLRLAPSGPSQLLARVFVEDGRSREFSVSFRLDWAGGWRLVAISLPE